MNKWGCMVLCRTFHTAPEQGQGPTPIVPPLFWFQSRSLSRYWTQPLHHSIVSLVTAALTDRICHERVTRSFNITCEQTITDLVARPKELYTDVLCNFRDEPVKKQQYPDDDDDDDFDEQERERMKDLKERDEFADRMKNKDKEKTRQIMSKSEKKVLNASFTDVKHLFY